MKRSLEKSIECFWSKAIPVTETGCFLWIGCDDGKGRYGRFKFKGKDEKAHRLSWKMTNGSIPEGLNVLHKCDVSMCVNPCHLFLGSQKENMRDCVLKGRFKSNKLESNPRAILNMNDVCRARSMFRTGNYSKYRLAKEFGISQTQMNRILNNQAWRE